MANAKGLKGRIESIKNTKKTTKAMELVSGAKMRRAVDSVVKTRDYYTTVKTMVETLRQKVDIVSETSLVPFFSTPQDGGKTLVIVLTSNRGLCGAFNSNIVKQVLKYKEEHPNEELSIMGIGKKGVAMLSAFDVKSDFAYEKDDGATDDSSVREVAEMAYKQFEKGEVQRVFVAYTHYESPINQTAVMQQLYPLPEMAGEQEAATEAKALYTYEPSESAVLLHIIPRFGEVQLYQALLESNASEHSSRMIAMKNATDAAGEMANELKLVYNRARQAAITQEIAEISAGTAAVS